MWEFQGRKVWYSGCLPCDISEPWALKKPLFFSLILWTWSFEAPQLCTVWSLNRERNSQIKKKKKNGNLLLSTYCIVCIHLVWVPSFFLDALNMQDFEELFTPISGIILSDVKETHTVTLPSFYLFLNQS